MLMDEPERAHVVLADLRALGVSIAIDDFGTGYSSLAYLKRLPIDEVKIDKAFVFGLGVNADPADAAIVRAVVAMAHPLRCEVVAEGVESAETWTFLRELGCDLAQGYYFSHPLPAAALEQWARTSRWGCTVKEWTPSRSSRAPVQG
jgi:EAL domain-containing protein (putative c-di-GMP-specific phosphodiesterase class I)